MDYFRAQGDDEFNFGPNVFDILARLLSRVAVGVRREL